MMQKRLALIPTATPEQAVLTILQRGGLPYSVLVQRAQQRVPVAPIVYSLVLARLVKERRIQRQDELYRLLPGDGYTLWEGPDGGDAA